MMEMGWEIGFGMEMGMEMKSQLAPPPATAFGAVTPSCLFGIPSAESLRVDELLDFTNHDLFPSSSSSSSSSSIPAAASGQLLPKQEFSSVASFDASFPDDIYIPSEEAAELEWLSKFVEDSFSETPYHYSLASHKTALEKCNFQGAEISGVGCVARGKISHDISSTSSSSSSSCSSDFPKGKAGASSRKKQGGLESGVRRCTHCASEKTPQWRTGPLGPKTLCNACGVRFKSGRLVPEYRPAASPTFVLTQHSNSHRKVIELRRQKEFLILRHNNPNISASDNSSGGGRGSATFSQELLFHDYEVY